MTQYSFIKWLCMQAITIGWGSKSNKKLTNIIFLISFVFPICALGVMFVIKVVNNSFALFGSLHYKVLVCCKTAADFSREIYFMRRTFTLSESQKTRASSRPLPRLHQCLKFSWQFAFEAAFTLFLHLAWVTPTATLLF